MGMVEEDIGAMRPLEDLMPESLYALAFLACPVGMGAMMWLMMRGNKHLPAGEADSAEKQGELDRMQGEIDQLRAATQDRASTSGPRPSP